MPLFPTATTQDIPGKYGVALGGYGFDLVPGTYRETRATPFAMQIGTGDKEYSDNRIWSTWAQKTWHRGRGEEVMEQGQRFFDSLRIHSRVPNQLTLGPNVIQANVQSADIPHYEIGRAVALETYDKDSLAGRMWTQKFQATGDLAAQGLTHIYLPLSRKGEWPSGGKAVDASNQLWAGLWADGASLVGHDYTLPAGMTYPTVRNTISGEDLPRGVVSWVKAAFNTTIYLTTGSLYHVGIYYPQVNSLQAPPEDWEQAQVYWAEDPAGGYAYKAYKTQWTPQSYEAPAAQAFSLYFRVNDGPTLHGGLPLDMIEYDGGGVNLGLWAVTQSGRIQNWDKANDKWIEGVANSFALGGITQAHPGVAVYGSQMLIARGGSYPYAWIANSGAPVSVCYATQSTWGYGAVAAYWIVQRPSKLWKARSNALSYGSDPSDGKNWSAEIQVGEASKPIVSMCVWNGKLIVGKEDSIWWYDEANDRFDKLVDLSNTPSIYNCQGMNVWPGDGALYVPVRYGLIRITGELGGTMSVNRVGPNLDAGLPWQSKGRVAATLAMTDQLLAAVDVGSDASSNQQSSILSFTGLVQGEGWHELATGEIWTGRTIAMVFSPSVEDKPRLWFGDGNTIKYCILDDKVENPRESGISEFAYQGIITLPRFYAAMRDIDKDWRSIQLEADNLGEGKTISVWHRTETLSWRRLGVVSTPGSTELALPDGTYSKWIQLRLVLAREYADQTPTLRVHALHYMPMLPARYMFSMRLKLKDTTTRDRLGGQIVRSVKDDMGLLEGLEAKVEPFDFIDPYGRVWEVKISSSSYAQVGQGNEGQDYEVAADITLLQVTERASGLMVTP